MPLAKPSMCCCPRVSAWRVNTHVCHVARYRPARDVQGQLAWPSVPFHQYGDSQAGVQLL